MILLQYIPFLILVILIVGGILVASQQLTGIFDGIILSSFAIYLVSVAWLIFTPGTYFFGAYDVTKYFVFHTAKIIYWPTGLFSTGSMMNVLMTVPAGIYYGIFSNHKLAIGNIIGLGILVGLFNETGQLILDVFVHINRTVDITDVITNTTGFVIGGIIATLFGLDQYIKIGSAK